MKPVKTAEEWLEVHNRITILDPDGWRGARKSWNDKITEEEFLRRLSESTGIWIP